MHTYPGYGNFDLDPRISVEGHPNAVVAGFESLRGALLDSIKAGRRLFAFDLYPGVSKAEALALARSVENAVILDPDAARLPIETLKHMFAANLTDDRVFGTLTTRRLADCYDAQKLEALRANARAQADAPVFVVGVGATLALPNPDEHWFWDVTRWEIQLRFRKGAGTWLFQDGGAPQLTKYKQGYFVEWRLADRYKADVMAAADYWVDANDPAMPRRVGRDAFWGALRQAARKPFHMQAYFDPSVWGGQWMKRVFGLDPAVENYGWSFDGVPEENALKFDFGGCEAVFPAMTLVKALPKDLLGGRVYGRFGAEFPIRFDFLDTFEGGNLSLQVHPMTGYIQETFGMHYTQDESYYILDADGDSCVYLGVKPGTDPKEMRQALEEANVGGRSFDVERFVNRIPVQKHDHVLIPAGTVHCSGKNTLVLEISATPYIFTFKLWDWDRLGLDGLPRPVHIEHGMRNIQFDRDTEWVERELIHRNETVEESPGVTVERTGLHEYEPIETRRYTVSGTATLPAIDSVRMINLVEGEKAFITSPSGQFEPLEIHFAETFVLPAAAGECALTAPEGKTVMFVAASVRA